jgi:TusA-related sulfurtransferase
MNPAVRDLDIRGQICPSTLLTTLREVNALRVPLRASALHLVVLTDSRDATHTIPGAVASMGYRVDVEPRKGHYAITLQRPNP